MRKDWNYDVSVTRFKNVYREVRQKGREVLKELKMSHEILTEDSKRKKDRKYPGKSFETYCRDIGISKVTGYQWLRKYFPGYLPERKNREEKTGKRSKMNDSNKEIIKRLLDDLEPDGFILSTPPTRYELIVETVNPQVVREILKMTGKIEDIGEGFETRVVKYEMTPLNEDDWYQEIEQ
jgi:hypothetical protein